MLQQLKELTKADRIQIYVSWFLQATIIIALIGSVFSQNWVLTFSTTIILLLMFSPQFIEKRFSINLPIEFELVITLFIYATLFLGEIKQYYTIYWWWDLLLHTASAIIFAFIGFMIVYILYNQRKLRTSSAFIAIFSFCFAMAIGAVWEIFEFTIDQTFGLNMQKSGLIDTMTDLIVDATGALIIAIIGYFYVRGGDSMIFNRLLKKFLKENPTLLKQNTHENQE